MNERIDWDAPASIHTKEALEREITRLRARVPERTERVPENRRSRLELNDWHMRVLESEPVDPPGAPDGDLRSVSVPFTVAAPYTHFRHRIDAEGRLGDSPTLHLEAADYEATIFLDGREIARHTGYAESCDVMLPGAGTGKHVVDVLVRRAVDYVTWDGTDASINRGDSHGKGLGSVTGDAITAGCGLLGRAWVEARPPVRVTDVYASADGDVVEVELELAGSEQVSVEVRMAAADSGDIVAATTLTADGSRGTTARLSVPGLRVWSPAEPFLYDVIATVRRDDAVLDEMTRRTGFRTLRRRADGSLELNGQPLFLRGTTSIGCLWQAGWAGDREAVVRQLLTVKALFANVLRLHVAVLPPLVYECADEIGLLLYQDAPLQWHCFEPAADRLETEIDHLEAIVGRVRPHPSVIVFSFPNEMHMRVPFHDSDVRFISGAFARLTAMSTGLLFVQDHSGEDRPRELPQSFHEYPGYFLATSGSVDSVLDSQSEGRRAIVSEYGGGAVPSWEAMTATADAHARDAAPFPLPADPDGPWTAESARTHVLAGALALTQRSVGRRTSFRDYQDRSGEHQARVLRLQTGRLRRDRSRVTGAIQHYLQNPAPYMFNAWVDLAIVDVAGHPTTGFDALREAFRVVAIEAIGFPERVFIADTVRSDVWVYNDLAESVDVTVRWGCADAAGTVVSDGLVDGRVPADSAIVLGVIELPARTMQAGDHVVTVTGVVADRAWTHDEYVIAVQERPEPYPDTIAVLGDLNGLADRTGTLLPLIEPWTGADGGTDTVLVTPGATLTEDDRHRLLETARRGGRVVLLERTPGDDLTWISSDPVGIAAGRIAEIAEVESSLTGSGLDAAAFRHWPTVDGRVITDPLLAADTRGTPQWASCGERLQYSAVHEFRVGYGSIVVCQAHVWDCLTAEPSAARLLQYMLSKPSRLGT